MLNGGIVPNFQDEITWRYSDPTFLARFKYFLFILVFAFGTIGLAFEAMMFVHASLKDSVFGIDQDLRRTFRNAIFTGFGVFLFILTSEIMENILGFGLAGGVIIGLGFLGVRRPVLTLIDGFSGKLIPTSYTFEETQYLKAYSDVVIDGEVSEKERTLLSTLATAYGIDDTRASDLEQRFDNEDLSNLDVDV